MSFARHTVFAALGTAVRASRRGWIRGVVAGLVAAAAELGLALAFGALARVVTQRSGSVLAVASALAIAAAIRVLAQAAIARASALASIDRTSALRRAGLDTILRADADAMEPASAALTRWIDLVPRAAQAHQATIALAAQAVQATLLSGLVLFLAPVLGAAMIAVLGVTAAFSALLSRRVRSRSAELGPAQRQIARTLERVSRNALQIRALGTESEERARLARAVDGHAGIARAVASASATAAALPVVPAMLAVGVLAAVGLRSGSEPGHVIAMLYAVVRLAAVLASAGHAVSAIVAAAPALDSLDSLDRDTARGPLDDHLPDATSAPPPSIRVSAGVVRAAGRTVLRDIHLEIAAGERLAIVGPSGVGKTTLLRTVLGLTALASGRISIDGSSPSEWRRNGGTLALVAAEPLVFAGTLRENLVYGLRSIPEDRELIRVLERASARSLVAIGLDAAIGEGGEGLSTGERQRLALARALAGSPSLIVMDEPTSGLEPDLEHEIASMIARLPRDHTLLIATHRPVLAAACDRILALSPGANGATARVLETEGPEPA